jgi:hypothetical protein
MNLTTDISTGIVASRFGRDQTFSNATRTTRWAESMDRQRALWGRFVNVVDEDPKEEGAK